MNVTERNDFSAQGAKEVKIPVPWGHISGTWLGPMDVEPLVTLHGWQDNAGSFQNLIPLLSPDLSILSIDLPGHGYSSHLPNGQFYYVFWDGVITLRRIVKHYRWDKVKLLGHSLGGAISFLYAAIYPDEVDSLICLDIASPTVRDVTNVVDTTADCIDKFLKHDTLSNETKPCYDYNDMIDILLHAYGGSINKKGAEILMIRGTQSASTDGQFHFTRDPRLKVSILGMISLDLVLAYAARIKCAYLNIRGVPGMKFDNPENYHKVLDVIKKGARKFEYHEVEGTHHVHLINPERIAPIITKFLTT